MDCVRGTHWPLSLASGSSGHAVASQGGGDGSAVSTGWAEMWPADSSLGGVSTHTASGFVGRMLDPDPDNPDGVMWYKTVWDCTLTAWWVKHFNPYFRFTAKLGRRP